MKNIKTLMTRARALADSISDDMDETQVAQIEARHAELIEQIELERTLQPREQELGLRSTGPMARRRAALIDALAERDEETSISSIVSSEARSGNDMRAAMADGILARVLPDHTPTVGRDFAGLSLVEVARHALSRNQSVAGLSASQIIERSFGGNHTTSDFGYALGDVASRVLRDGYTAAPAALKAIARQTSARDFRAKSSIMLSAFSELEKVNENGEFKYGTIGESAESYKIATYGKIFGITRQALINDDLGALSALPSRLGQASAAFEAKFLAELLEANPKMADGKAVFHAGHGNLLTEAALSVDALSAARLALRQQKGLADEPIAVSPRFLVVPSTLETKGEQVLAAIAAMTVDTVNPFSGKLTLVVEPRLTNPTAWYVAADPTSVAALEYAYLEGQAGPSILTRQGFEIDAVECKVRLDFGGGFMDHRGIVKNPGQ